MYGSAILNILLVTFFYLQICQHYITLFTFNPIWTNRNIRITHRHNEIRYNIKLKFKYVRKRKKGSVGYIIHM